jgi:hypothetical protein
MYRIRIENALVDDKWLRYNNSFYTKGDVMLSKEAYQVKLSAEMDMHRINDELYDDKLISDTQYLVNSDVIKENKKFSFNNLKFSIWTEY